MERISPVQLAYLLITSRAVIMLALLPVVSTTPGGRDAWLASLIAFLPAMLYTWLACRLTAKMPEMDLIQMCERCLGKVLGKAAGLLFLSFFALNAAIVIRQFSEFLKTAPMVETPTEVLVGVMALTTAYAIRKGLEPIARANELLLLPLFLFVIMVLLMGLPQMDLSRLKPYLAEGLGPPLLGSATAGALWAEVMIIPMLGPMVSKPHLLFRYAMAAVVVNTLWLFVSALSVILFFGAPEAQLQVFPIYSLMRSVTLADFLERMDPLFLIAWTIASITKLALLSYVSCQALGRILGLADFRVLALPMGLAGTVVALTQFDSITDLAALNAPTVVPILVLPFGLLLPLLLLVTSPKGKSGRRGS